MKGIKVSKLEGSSRFSVTDYLGWTDEERCELVDGRRCPMTPTPTPGHQLVVLEVHDALKGAMDQALAGSLIQNRPGERFVGPIDVVLDPYTVVQPDLIVVCDSAKVGPKNIQGAPDLVVEVVSPSSARMDRWIKRNAYERAGVPEYLLVDPIERHAELFHLGPDGKFGPSRVMLPEEALEAFGLSLGLLQEILGPEVPE